jgi:hypothetical protein
MKKQLSKPTSVQVLMPFLALLTTVTSLTANAQRLEIISNNVTTTETYLGSDKQETVEWDLEGDGNITNISQLEKAMERSVYQSDDTNSFVSESESTTNIIPSSYDNTPLTTKNFPSFRANFMPSSVSTVAVLNKEVLFTSTAFANDNGSSNSDGATNDAAPTISGSKTGDCHKFSRDGGSSWVSVSAVAGNTEDFNGTLVVSSGTLDNSPTETATTTSTTSSFDSYAVDVPDTFFFDITTPTGSTDKEVLFESGGGGIGITIFIEGTDLKISVGNDGSASDLTASNVFADGTRYAIIVELAPGKTVNFYVANMSGSDLPKTFGAAVASQANAWSGKWSGPNGAGWGQVGGNSVQGQEVNAYSSFSGTFHEGRFYSAKGFSEVWTDGTLEVTDDQTINTNINEDVEISDTGSLTVEGADINGDVTITDGGSLIVTGDGNVTGTVTYVRSISTTNWYLISSPVTEQDIDDFVANSNLATGTGDNVGFSDYDNATGIWTYYQVGTTDTGNFVSGKGHAVKLNATGSLRFTGGFNNGNASVAVSSGAANNFNLIGNPYLANVSVSEMVTANAALLEEQTVWLWDEAESAYIQRNLTEDLEVAPGQGFFVLTNAAGNFSITEAMQSHYNIEDTFKSSDNRPEINLVITNGAEVRDADIYYIDGTTTGFDNGYDSSIFGGVTNEFAIYTQAVANGTGKDLGIQSLPNNDFENMVIPVGINATSGTEIIISATSANLPTGIHVYLEDKDDNSFTLLDDSSTLQTTFTNTSNGVGRFFIHTKTQPLNADQAELNNVSIYLSDDNYLRIVGVQQGDTQVHIYSILGKQVVSTSFEGAGVNDILLPNLSMGIYMVQLKTKNGKLNKKIIIQQ